MWNVLNFYSNFWKNEKDTGFRGIKKKRGGPLVIREQCQEEHSK